MEFKVSHKLGSNLSSKEKRDIFEIFHADQMHSSDQERLRFEDRWMAPYFEDDPERSHFYMAKNQAGKVMSYLIGYLDSQDLISSFAERVRAYGLFQDLFTEYPVHLHINNHPDARGHGLGSKVMKSFLSDLRSSGRLGVHLVTAPESRNVSFYQSNGFNIRVVRNLTEKTQLLFLAQSLQD